MRAKCLAQGEKQKLGIFFAAGADSVEEKTVGEGGTTCEGSVVIGVGLGDGVLNLCAVAVPPAGQEIAEIID